jgi:hypothetical protein
MQLALHAEMPADIVERVGELVADDSRDTTIEK